MSTLLATIKAEANKELTVTKFCGPASCQPRQQISLVVRSMSDVTTLNLGRKEAGELVNALLQAYPDLNQPSSCQDLSDGSIAKIRELAERYYSGRETDANVLGDKILTILNRR
jgi:hypothetical protein